MIGEYVQLCCRLCCNRSSASYEHKDSLGVSGGGGIAVPVVKSMSSSTWSSHDSPSTSWTTQPHDADSYRYSAHQRLLLNHSATCNPAGITHGSMIDLGTGALSEVRKLEGLGDGNPRSWRHVWKIMHQQFVYRDFRQHLFVTNAQNALQHF